MSSDAPSPAPTTARFQVQRVLGSGGTATVYEVLDQAKQQHVALKRLHPTSDPQRRRRMLDLFEREFYTLSRISHPCVVEAYDYGVDEHGAYYTMELLQGRELQALSPLPFRRACSVARAVRSALSLLNSRRLVYRDLNPRNVQCLDGGAVKLLDFGATANVGPCTPLVGTPAYCAPEALHLEPLDGRTDLYSLGATLYFAVTGRHVYPAKTFAQLRELWEAAPIRPSALVPALPAALDALIMDLLARSVRTAGQRRGLDGAAGCDRRPHGRRADHSRAGVSHDTDVGRSRGRARACAERCAKRAKDTAARCSSRVHRTSAARVCSAQVCSKPRCSARWCCAPSPQRSMVISA